MAKTKNETAAPSTAAPSQDQAQPAQAPVPINTLALWNSLQATDPRYTKQFNRGGFNGTAINGTYIAKRLTEAFGPCGMGWKLVLEHEVIIDGPNDEKLHAVRCHIDYRIHDAKGIVNAEWLSTSPQFGQTKLVQYSAGDPSKNKSPRLIFDEEAPKKSLTDAMSKCASLLGIASDVHLGLYDDNKYVNEVKALFEKEPKAGKAEKKPEPDVVPVPPSGLDRLNAAIADAGLDERAFCKKYQIAKPENLPFNKLDEALENIAKYKAGKKPATTETTNVGA